METDPPLYGFWQVTRKTITEIDEFDGSPTVTIACTQLNRTPVESKRILRDWIEALPSMPVNFVRFSCHVPDKLLQATFLNPRIRGLFIKWTRAKSIEGIERLQNLEELHLGNASSISDLSPLASLHCLRVLDLENLAKISDYSILRALTGLESLCIEGGMYSRPYIDDLEFVADLTALKEFQLVAMRCRRPRLEPFRKLSNLIAIGLCCDFHNDECKAFDEQMPNLRFGFAYQSSITEENIRMIKAQLCGSVQQVVDGKPPEAPQPPR